MTDITALKKANATRWANVQLNPNRFSSFDAVARKLVASKSRYKVIEAKTGVPWFIVAVIHEREGDARFDTYLGNGQSLSQITTEVPEGRGPFLGADAWERGCYDALIDCAPHASKWGDWSAGGALTLLEEYNGLGYASRGIPSPYVWSGTNQYKSGKYVADHVFDPNTVDVQDGCAPLIVRMMALDTTIKFEAPKLSAAPSDATKHGAGAIVVAGGTVAAAAAHSNGMGTGGVIAILIVAALAGAAIWVAIHQYQQTKAK